MSRLATILLGLALVPVAAALAPVPRAQQQETDSVADRPKEIGLEEQAAASLAQLDITVIGPPEVVTRLTTDDFRIKINFTWLKEFELDRRCDPDPTDRGASVSSSESQPSAAPTAPAASYLFYFDQPHLTLAGRQRSIDVAHELVEQLITDRNRGMIVSNARRTVVLQPLTSDTAQLGRALDGLEGNRDQWDMYAQNEELRIADVVKALNEDNDLTHAVSLARLYQKEEYWTTNRNLRRLAMTLGQLVDLAPPKVLIYFADITRSNPGEHYLSFFGTRLRAAQPMLGAMSADALAGGLAIDHVVDEAAAQGIRIYTVEARGLVADADRAQVSSVAMSATQAVPASSRVRLGDTHRTLQGISAETGGYAFLHGARAGKIAERIRTDSSCVYLASFDPSGFATDAPLRVVVEIDRGDVKLRVRGRIVIQSASARKTSALLRAFSAPNSIPDPFEVQAGLVPTGFEKGQYSALLQVTVPGSPFRGATWDLGASMISGQKVREKASGRLSASGPSVRVILESQLSFKPGAYELVAVAHEESSGMVASSEFRFEWPQLKDAETMVGPIVLMQPVTGAFMRRGETRLSGSLLVAGENPILTARPAAFVGLVCRGKRKEPVRLVRKIVGDSTHDFPDLELDADDDLCAQIRDVVPSNSLPAGYYRYSVAVLASGEELDEGHRDFVVLASDEAVTN